MKILIESHKLKEWRLFTSGNNLFCNQYKFYFKYTLSFELVFVYESYRSSESEASFIQHSSTKHHYSIMLGPDLGNGMKQCIYILLRNCFLLQHSFYLFYGYELQCMQPCFPPALWKILHSQPIPSSIPDSTKMKQHYQSCKMK